MKSVVGYVRVSTTGQAQDGVSLDMQESKIRAYCTLNDLVLEEIICDAGLSGKNLSRPGVQRLLDLIKSGEVSGVVIYSLSRLGRSTADLLDIAKLMDRKGVIMHSLTEKIDTSTAVGRFFFVLTGALAEMERGLISERTKAALSEKRSQGLRTTYKAPYGHRFTSDGRVIEDNEEQAILRRVWNLGANGASVREIQRTLAADGIVNRNGHPFAVSAVFYMLKKCA